MIHHRDTEDTRDSRCRNAVDIHDVANLHCLFTRALVSLCQSVAISQTPAPPTPAARPPRGLAPGTRVTASRPRGPKSSVQSFTYMPTNWSACRSSRSRPYCSAYCSASSRCAKPVLDALLEQPLRLRGPSPCPDSCARHSPRAAAASRSAPSTTGPDRRPAADCWSPYVSCPS